MIKNILVTGANGFIGSNLTKYLQKESYNVIEYAKPSFDILNKIQIENVDYVIHLASQTYVPESWNRITDFLETNIIGTTNVLNFCNEKKIPLLFVSAYLYGIPEFIPISEIHNVKPNNPYALSKHLAEQVCMFYNNVFSLDITIVRPFNIYGPGQNSNFLISKILEQIYEKSEVDVFDLLPKRDYLYIDDFLHAISKIIKINKKGYNVYNIGSGTSHSVQEIIDLVKKISGIDFSVNNSNKKRLNEIDNVIADVSKARLELNWYPRISIESGLKKCIAFYE